MLAWETAYASCDKQKAGHNRFLPIMLKWSVRILPALKTESGKLD